MFKTIEEAYSTEIIVKKSKFISNIFYVSSEEDALNKIKEIKKKFYDARHNCYAYRINLGDNVLERYSDDGEPGGTAGQPILNVIKGAELENVLVVVTRYFGGILLGTGGLVKAYTDSAKKAISEIQIVKKTLGNLVKVEIEYQDLEKVKYYMRQNNIRISKNSFLENVELFLEIPPEKLNNLEDDLNKENFKIINLEKIKENIIISVVE